MKRDMDLIRDILLRAANADFGVLSSEAFAIEGYDARTVAAHFELLDEAGLVDADLLTLERSGVHSGKVLRVTWAGHDYLDAVRDATVWRKVKKTLGDKLGSAPVDVVKALAVKYMSAKLGLTSDR